MKKPSARLFKFQNDWTARLALLAGVILWLAALTPTQAATYALDNNSISTPINASDGTEPLDNWFGNVFIAQAGANVITRVDFGVFTTTSNSAASVVLYQVTDPGGNPALGATRLYTQAFTPLTGDNTNAFLQQIDLTNPVTISPGARFLVAVFIRNVIAAPPNDVYPYLLDTSGSATGSYWDRSTPNTFDLDNLSQAKLVSQPLVPGGFAPGNHHIIIRAVGVAGPCIGVVKQCAYPPNSPTCFPAGAGIDFTGYVTNCGDVRLTNVTVSDSRPLVGAGLLDTNGSPLIQPLTLDPGQAVGFRGSFAPTSTETCAGAATNSITVSGTDVTPSRAGPNISVTNVTSTTCAICTANPSISVTKACASPIVTNVGSSLTVTGQVCNTGTIAFDNVVVVDSQPSGVTPSATNILGSLAPGQCKPYSFTYTATTCDPNHDTVTATGTSACGTATATASADCFLCCPGITIQTLVGCLLPGAVCPGNSSDYSPQATGVKGNLGDPTADNPAFCYIIIVRNTGHDPLTNIVIHDDHLGAIGTFPGPLAVGGTITISNLRTNWAATTTNTSMVTAQCGGVHANGAAVSATTNAVAVVLSGASVACAMSISSPDDLDGNPNDAHVSISSSGNHSVTFKVVITAGGVPLANVTLTSPTLASLGCPLPSPFSLPATSNFTYVCTTSINCTNISGGVLTNVAVITGQIATSPGVCAQNITGTNVLVASTNSGPPCAVVLECNSNHPPVAKCKNIVVSADAHCQGDGSVNDGSFDPDGDAITIVQSPVGPYPLGTNGVTLCVTDSQGASNCCNATVTVVDTTPPVITCQPSRTNEWVTGAVPVFGNPTATDTCDTNLTITFVDDQLPATCPAVRIFRRTWTATDDCTNRASCSQIITFVDTTPPVITCQPSRTNECVVGAVPVFGNPTATDTCDTNLTITFVDDQLPATCPAVRIFRRTWTATDDCTNRASCSQTITFIDTTPPTITCPTNTIVVGNDPQQCSAKVAYETNATDNCCLAGFTCEPPSGSVFPVGTTTVTCVAVDCCSNSASCSFDIIVEDREAPVGMCIQGVNPSGGKIPVAGKNPASGQNPDGYYQLLGKDNCDPNPVIFIADTGSRFVAGPFASGDVIKLTQSPGKTPSQDPAPAPIVAHLHFKGDGVLYTVDAAGNISEGQLCLVPRPPK